MDILIADSGGTKTDWCLLGADGLEIHFQTESYHPAYWSSDFEDRIRQFWQTKDFVHNTKLVFYGSGCFNLQNATQLTRLLLSFGFAGVEVKSDMHAAGLAAYGNMSGVVAILGTGSVLFDWTGTDVKNVRGGLGYENGDEGSGFYFGKLVFNAFKNDELPPDKKQRIEGLLNTEINQKTLLSSFSKELEDDDYFNKFHQQNIREFIVRYCDPGITKMSLVGGYAGHCSELVISEFKENGIEVEKIIVAPIERIIDQMR